MKQYYVATKRSSKAGFSVLLSLLILGMVNNALYGLQDVNEQDLKKMPSARREIDLIRAIRIHLEQLPVELAVGMTISFV